jgi:hypothetical protein
MGESTCRARPAILRYAHSMARISMSEGLSESDPPVVFTRTHIK